MKYYIIFDDDKLDILNEFNNTPVTEITTDIESFSVAGDTMIRKFPAEMPVSSSYDFQSYHNGYAKGYNDCLKTLQGQKLGEYDPEKDKVED